MQVLEAARHGGAVSVRKVQLTHSDVRGEIVTTDPVTDGKDNAAQSTVVPFRTVRTGFERDPGLYALLSEAAGGAYQGAEEDSTLRAVGSGLMTVLLFGALTVGLVLMVRWMTGGGSPFSFGRSRAKLYAQKDVEVTFRDVAGIDEAVAELREWWTSCA